MNKIHVHQNVESSWLLNWNITLFLLLYQFRENTDLKKPKRSVQNLSTVVAFPHIMNETWIFKPEQKTLSSSIFKLLQCIKAQNIDWTCTFFFRRIEPYAESSCTLKMCNLGFLGRYSAATSVMGVYFDSLHKLSTTQHTYYLMSNNRRRRLS